MFGFTSFYSIFLLLIIRNSYPIKFYFNTTKALNSTKVSLSKKLLFKKNITYDRLCVQFSTLLTYGFTV